MVSEDFVKVIKFFSKFIIRLTLPHLCIHLQGNKKIFCNFAINMEPDNEIILYQPDSTVSLEVRVEDNTVWLTQQQIAELFGVKQPAISKNLKNIFQSGGLDEFSVHSILEYTAADGKTYRTASGS